MKKDEAINILHEAGINTEGLSWNELHSLAVKTLKEKPVSATQSNEYLKLKRELEIEKAKNKELQIKYENRDSGRAPTAEELLNNPILVAPHIPHMGRPKNPKYLFEEELGQDVVYEDIDYVKNGIPQNMKQGEQRMSGFQHCSYKKNKVTATTGGPLQNPGLELRSDEKFLTVFDGNREGYLWSQAKKELMKINHGYYYQKYMGDIYGGNGKKGKLTSIMGRYAIEKTWFDAVLQDITKAEKKRKVEERGY